MRKLHLIIFVAALAVCSCKEQTFQPRPTIPLVESIVRDTSGLAAVAASAGKTGASGTVAIFGEPDDCVPLAKLFHSTDLRDNIDGRPVRDSLPDFAGECFYVIMDDYQADNLRESAVRGAMHAWDSTCRAKALVLASPLHTEFGLFDIDTLQQLTGGTCKLFSPVLETVREAGDANVAVWASREVRAARVYENAWKGSGSLVSITPEQDLDIRGGLRSLLGQYSARQSTLDAIILTSYDADLNALQEEIGLIRLAETDEDVALARKLSRDFRFIEPGACVADAVYRWLRQSNLFTHRIAYPEVRYYHVPDID